MANTREDYVELGPSQFQEVSAFPFSYQANFPLLPGRYQISVILRNRVSKQYTIAETSLAVLPLSSNSPMLSDIVLAYSIEQLMSAGTTEKEELRTFQVGDACVRPAADGLFSLGETAHVFFQVLGASLDSRLHFALLDGEKVLQERTSTLSTYLGGAVIEQFPLRGLAGGRYSFRVRLLDPGGRVLAERTANCQISPLAAVSRPWVRRVSFGSETPGLLALARGTQLVAEGRLPEAKLEFEEAMASGGPTVPMARWKLALISIDGGDAARALELLTPIEQDFPNQYEVVAGLGLSYGLLGDCSKGIDYLERARTIRPPDTNVLNMLGGCYRRLGENQKAAEAFQRSLDLNPEQEQIQKLLASVRNDGS
jgi:tetratricopeptide (TPR) repeat protein